MASPFYAQKLLRYCAIYCGVIWRPTLRNIVALVALSILISGCTSTAPLINSYECTTLNECIDSISKRVQANAKWICDTKSNDKNVTVSTLFSRTGEILEINVIQSSEDVEFDNGALKAVLDSAPYVEISMLSETDFKEASKVDFLFTGNKTID
jgi:hypothetical protein